MKPTLRSAPLILAVAALTACGGSAAAPRKLTADQLKSALITSSDLSLPAGYTAGSATSGATTQGDAVGNDIDCPGVGTYTGEQNVGDPTATITFSDTGSDTLEEDLETLPDKAAVVKDVAGGTAILDKCKAVSISGSTLAVTKLAAPSGCDESASYQFAGSLQGKTIELVLKLCGIGTTELNIDTANISGSADSSLAAAAVTAAIAKLKKA